MENLSCLSRRRVKQNTLASRFLLPPFSQVMLADYPDETGTRIPHVHGELQIIALLSGKMRFTTERDFSLSRGDLLLIPPATRHAWSVQENGRTLQLLISPSLMAEYPDLRPLLIKTAIKLSIDPEKIEAVRNRIAGEQGSILPAANIIISAQLLDLLAHILRIYSRTHQGINGMTHEGITKALNLIAADYRKKLTLHRLAVAAGLSISRFSSLFHRQTGRSPVDFLLNYRLERAREMLGSTDMKIYEIAEYTGFDSVSYFNRKFKSVYRHTPAFYRKNAGTNPYIA